MRLHSLSVSAFGPFAGTERVDFDELNDAGLFLLTGPTGAGKSSLLDAVCFALYGTVPGARGVKTLKSQHAPADARPEVVLDVTVQSRRFLIRRSPEWTRPKKRGTGLALEKASASITETTGGVEHFLSARAAEVGLLVHDLMGMSAGQFVQVALLPQGEFQTFLRASSQERHDVLQQLFGTDRFARIEDWVHERSRRLKGEAAVGESAVQRILDTVADRAATHVPDALSGEALPVAAAEGEVLPWLGATLCAARTDAGLARGAHDVARADLTSARLRLEVGTRQAEQRLRRVAADRTLAALAESEPTALAARAALEGHQRATRCLPVLELHARAQLNRERAADDRDAAVRALAGA
ncbi:MAG: SMC family ATPase, partial [Nocardioidaceae bacterium]